MAAAVEKERAAAAEAEKRLRGVHARSEQLAKVRALQSSYQEGKQPRLRHGAISMGGHAAQGGKPTAVGPCTCGLHSKAMLGEALTRDDPSTNFFTSLTTIRFM